PTRRSTDLRRPEMLQRTLSVLVAGFLSLLFLSQALPLLACLFRNLWLPTVDIFQSKEIQYFLFERLYCFSSVYYYSLSQPAISDGENRAGSCIFKKP